MAAEKYEIYANYFDNKKNGSKLLWNGKRKMVKNIKKKIKKIFASQDGVVVRFYVCWLIHTGHIADQMCRFPKQ